MPTRLPGAPKAILLDERRWPFNQDRGIEFDQERSLNARGGTPSSPLHHLILTISIQFVDKQDRERLTTAPK